MSQLSRLSATVSRWMHRHPRFRRYSLFGSCGLLFVVLVVQLMYPAGRVLPFVSVEGESVGGRTIVQAAKLLDADYAKAKATVVTDNKRFTKPFEEIGIEIRSTDTVRSAARYTLWQRIIPFSSVYIMTTRDTSLLARFDDGRLRYFGQEVEKQGFTKAVNASVAVSDGKIKLVPARPSKSYPMANVVSALKSAHLSPRAEVKLTPKTKQAERTDDEVKGVLGEAQRAIDTPLTLKLDKEKIPVSKNTIGGWLNFPEDPTTKRLTLGLKADVVRKYLGNIQGKIYKAPGTSRVQLIDGVEVGRTNGSSGRGIDADKAIPALEAAIKKGAAVTLTIPIATLAPPVVYDRQYSNSDAGLTAMLNDLGRSRGYGISIMELGGRSANANGNKRFVAASTYKLFVSYALFKEIEAGRMSWAGSINGRSVAECFDAMIVRSDNPCAKAFGDRIGWQNIENMMRSLGLGNTDLSPSLYTTANDLALFLYKLQNGSLASPADTSRLIDAMKRNIYRAGIPAGTGLTVANKVGFIDSYIHDAGIVYGPRGPYVMVIMTSGSSWSGIADAARQINAFLNR